MRWLVSIVILGALLVSSASAQATWGYGLERPDAASLVDAGDGGDTLPPLAPVEAEELCPAHDGAGLVMVTAAEEPPAQSMPQVSGSAMPVSAERSVPVPPPVR